MFLEVMHSGRSERTSVNTVFVLDRCRRPIATRMAPRCAEVTSLSFSPAVCMCVCVPVVALKAYLYKWICVGALADLGMML